MSVILKSMEVFMSICKSDSLKKGASPMSSENNLAMKKNETHSDTDSDSGDRDSSDLTPERDTWNRKVEYVLSMIGMCVGLGNIWRFPYVCMRNGGGAFLIPFIFALLICGFPMYFLEVSIGQFLRKGPWHAWSICPLLRGIGLSMYILCLVWGWYFSIILAWCLIYMVNSLKFPLPWTQCGQSWNTENCIVPEEYWAKNGADVNSTASLYLSGNSSADMPSNGTLDFLTNETQVNRTVSLSTDEFWLYKVLELTSGIDDMGGLPWHTVVGLIASNLVILLALIRGINSSGKFGCVETLITTLGDLWPVLIRRYRTLTTCSTVGVLTLAGLLFAARGGGYLFQLVDWYIASISLLSQAFLECIVVAWIYGADRFCYDVKLMIGSEPPRIVIVLWKVVTPFVLIILFFITLAFYEPPTFAGYSYPAYSLVIGWIISIVPFLSIVVYAGYMLLRSKGSLKKRLQDSCRPSNSWQPADAEARAKYCCEALNFKLSDLESDLPDA